jgi:hypothetical protein
MLQNSTQILTVKLEAMAPVTGKRRSIDAAASASPPFSEPDLSPMPLELILLQWREGDRPG